MLFVAMGLVVAAIFRCEAGTTRPANGIGERGHVTARERNIPLCLCVWLLKVVRVSKGPKKLGVDSVKCKLSSGEGCLKYVERGQARRCVKRKYSTPRILARRLGDEFCATPSRPLTLLRQQEPLTTSHGLRLVITVHWDTSLYCDRDYLEI